MPSSLNSRPVFIDYYLLHSLSGASWADMRNLGVREFLDSAKKDGGLKMQASPFMATLSSFKEIVNAYDWEFCQIQYNYLDQCNQAGTEGLEYAASKRRAVIIMEPLRGGNLAGQIPAEV